MKKKYIIIFLISLLLIGITGCSDYEYEYKEENYESESEEDRTYNGVVYNKAFETGYVRVKHDRHGTTRKNIVILNSNGKDFIYMIISNSGVCHYNIKEIDEKEEYLSKYFYKKASVKDSLYYMNDCKKFDVL